MFRAHPPPPNRPPTRPARRREQRRPSAVALFAFKAQLCGIRFPQEANHDLGQQVYTIRMHNAPGGTCKLSPAAAHREVHPHQIGVIKFTYPGGARVRIKRFSLPFFLLAARSSRCYVS